jgi:hypothetical protein
MLHKKTKYMRLRCSSRLTIAVLARHSHGHDFKCIILMACTEAVCCCLSCLQVKDWANGQAGDIGELAMVPGTLSTGFTAGSSSPSAAASAAAAAAAAAEDSGPFWQQLAQHAQYLEVRDAFDLPGAVCQGRKWSCTVLPTTMSACQHACMPAHTVRIVRCVHTLIG